MTYVIGEPCVDMPDRACVEECPGQHGHDAPQPCAALARRRGDG